MKSIHVTAAPKNTTFHMRIDPEVKQLLASSKNEAYMKAKAMRRLMAEIQQGWDSAERDGWISEEDAYRVLGVEG